MSNKIGVVIGRFQAPSLTLGHKHLFTQVAAKTDRILVMVGVPPVPLTKRNPLPYELRQASIGWFFRGCLSQINVSIVPLLDNPCNTDWAAEVDRTIAVLCPHDQATIYHGPDGVGPSYKMAGGRWPIIEILSHESARTHASEIRARITPQDSDSFRAGMIYAVQNKFDNPIPVVDIAIYDPTKDTVLLGQKPHDKGKYRFIGGFVDADDKNLEYAACREAEEETGLEVGCPVYCGSSVIQDWRYRYGPERIMSSLFLAPACNS